MSALTKSLLVAGGIALGVIAASGINHLSTLPEPATNAQQLQVEVISTQSNQVDADEFQEPPVASVQLPQVVQAPQYPQVDIGGMSRSEALASELTRSQAIQANRGAGQLTNEGINYGPLGRPTVDEDETMLNEVWYNTICGRMLNNQSWGDNDRLIRWDEIEEIQQNIRAYYYRILLLAPSSVTTNDRRCVWEAELGLLQTRNERAANHEVLR